MKFTVILALLVSSLSTFANDYYTLRKNKKNCFVKAYKNKEFEDVPYKRFESLKILARPHKKDPTYMVFKVDNQIYITKYKCLEEYDIVDEADLPDSKPEENHIATNSRVIRTDLSGLKFSEKKYFISLDYGMVSVGDKSPVMDYQDELEGSVLVEDESSVFDIGKTPGSNYRASNMIGLSGGWRASENRFYSFKLKRFSGSKTDNIPLSLSNVDQGVFRIDYKDNFYSFLIGNKLIFLPNSKIKPFLSIHLGLSLIESTFRTISAINNSELNFRSSKFSIEAETGVEILLSDNFGLSMRLGYDYLGKRTFVIEGDQDEDVPRGFKSLMDYSNLYTTFGLITYF
jgi:hypothetical protein